MKIITLVLLLFSISIFAQQKQEKHHHAKIYYSPSQGLNSLQNLGISIEHGNHKSGVFVSSVFSESELRIARDAGYRVEILIEDSAAHFLKRNKNLQTTSNFDCANDDETYVTPENFVLGSMGGYFTYQEVLEELDKMALLYPDIISVRTGITNEAGVPFLTEGEPDTSVTPSIGGNEIQWVKISDNPNTDEEEAEILYTAIHHAREPMSLSQLIFYMWYLLENYEDDPEVQGIVNNTELYFVPVINPDGYLYNESTNPEGGGFWRKNRRNNGDGSFGVDNNRNYDYHIGGDPTNGSWGGEGASDESTSDIYHGVAPFSEIENQAMKSFVEQHNFKMAFNNHSFSELLLRPFGYALAVPTPEEELFEALGAVLTSKNGYSNIISSDLYAAAGISDDFMYGTVGTHEKIYSYTPEIGPSFWPPSNSIIPIAKEMMYHNITSSQMVNSYAIINDVSPDFLGASTSQNQEFSIQRLGLSGSGDFTVSLVGVSANITSIGDTVMFTGMDLLSSDFGSIAYTLASETSPGEAVVFDLIVNNGLYDISTRVEKVFGTTEVLFEDEIVSLDNYDNNGFGITSEDFFSGPYSVTDSPGGLYDFNDDKSIMLAESLDLTSAINAQVTFYTKFDIENRWDYAQFQISIDGGANWIPQCGRYTKPGSDLGEQPEGEPLYDGRLEDWAQEEIDLSDYLGETISARFIFNSDEFINLDGFYFDNLEFTVLSDEALVIEEVADDFKVYPNPVNNLVRISTALRDYSVTLYNLQGQKIKEVQDKSGSVQLDYSDLSSGMYLMVLTSDEKQQSMKLIKR